MRETAEWVLGLAESAGFALAGIAPAEGSEEGLFGNTFGQSPVPIGVLVEPSGRRAYVANAAADAVVVIDVATWKVVARIETGAEPDGLGWSPLVASATSDEGAAAESR